MNTWIKDDRGNKCSVEYFGSKEAAQKALDSLENCDNCTNCSDCSGCFGCSGCSGCSDCSRCSDCSYCSDCSRCSRCSDCSGCSGCSDCSRCSVCSDCSDCSDCSRCSVCSDCSDCSGCFGCSRCSDCSDCSGCSDCSNVARLMNNKRLRGYPVFEFAGPPAIPTIEGIHTKVFEVASAPGALEMDRWHTCNTTRCRAGWVVHLAGEPGYALARFHGGGDSDRGTALAAQLIYRESSPLKPVSPVRFYDTNDQALADMKSLAEQEAALSHSR